MAQNLLNVEHVSHAYGTRILLDDVTLGLSAGDVIGVAGRNGDGKTTLLRILTGALIPDAGRVTRNGAVSIGYLHQIDDFSPTSTTRDIVLDGAPDHVWASDPMKRGIVTDLLAGIDLDADVAGLSGGERRRIALVALMFGGHDLLVLDEPTNHLDVEAVTWLARHLNELQRRGTAMLVVSHDRWFLDAICTRMWEVHDATVDAFDGGYAAYILARVERQRMAAATEQRRLNLARKELAWLRRGAPARTSKPKFRIDAANELIADVPEPRDSLELQRFAAARIGKDVIDLINTSVAIPGRTLINQLTWSVGPGDRIGIIGANGSGKTTLLRLLTGVLPPQTGKVKHGKTLRLQVLSQLIEELPSGDTVLESVEKLKRETTLATGKEVSASTLLTDFGFTGDKLVTRIGELSGGERRRLQFLRLILSEPNVLVLDEPTNDLDIDTLTVIEDYLDGWPGTLIVVSHDRYFLERACDVIYGMLGDGTVRMLPRGVDEYLEQREAQRSASTSTERVPKPESASASAAARQAKKDLARIEQQLSKLDAKMSTIHQQMATAAADYDKLMDLQRKLDALQSEKDERELDWLSLAEAVE